jgi:hypothetical protein
LRRREEVVTVLDETRKEGWAREPLATKLEPFSKEVEGVVEVGERGLRQEKARCALLMERRASA